MHTVNVLSRSMYSKYFTAAYMPSNSKLYVEYLRCVSVSVLKKYLSTSLPSLTYCFKMAPIAVREALCKELKMRYYMDEPNGYC